MPINFGECNCLDLHKSPINHKGEHTQGNMCHGFFLLFSGNVIDQVCCLTHIPQFKKKKESLAFFDKR